MQQNIMNGLKGATGVMANINQDMNVQEISQVMREFNKEMGKAEIQNEMVADAMDMAEGAGVADDADEVYNQILGEVGMSVSAGAVGTGNIAVQQQEEVK